MKILVTGGLGYIGSHTVLALVERGYEPLIIDDLSNSNIKTLKTLKKISDKDLIFKKIDLKNKTEARKFFKENLIDGVIHFAAFKAVGESVNYPLKYYKNNIYSLVNLLYLCEEFKINNFIFSSSCTVYGQPKKLPIKETSPFLSTPSPYGKTKQISEYILMDTTKSSNLKVFSLRYFNPIGAHKSGKLGEQQSKEPQNLVPQLTKTACSKNNNLKVYGGDYETPDGTAIRDYLDINDLADAHVIALEKVLRNKSKEGMFDSFNLGTGKGTSVLNVIKSFEQASGLKIKYQICKKREGDIKEIYADISKSKKLLGWESKTPLTESLMSAYQWELKLP